VYAEKDHTFGKDRRLMTDETFESIAAKLREECARQDQWCGRYGIMALLKVAMEAREPGSADETPLDPQAGYSGVHEREVWWWRASPEEIFSVSAKLVPYWLSDADAHDFYRIALECLTSTHMAHIRRAIEDGTYAEHWKREDRRDDKKVRDAFLYGR
jgi:hypothetical protein